MPLFEFTMFKRLFIFVPYLTALDGFRRVWLGGTSLAFFIDISAGMLIPPPADLFRMQLYLNMEEDLWDRIPPWLQVPLTPFIDYHDACQAVLAIFLAIQGELPVKCKTCAEYREGII